MSALDDQARAKILQISTAEEPDSVSPALVSTAMDLLRQIGSANEQAISQTDAAASALGDRTSILEKELTRQVGSLLKDATTSGTDQWIFVSQSVRKGEVLAIEWSCPTTGNHFSFQSGDSSLAYVETLYNVESSTETSGLWYINAPKNIASLGNLVEEGRKMMMTSSRYQLIFPALVVTFITVSFYLVGNAFADAADPRNHV